MLFTYNIDNLDLSIFKKHSTHYLSNMASLGLKKLEFCLHLNAFEINIFVSNNHSDGCWINFFLREHGYVVSLIFDPRFYNLKLFREVFSEGYNDWGSFRSKDSKTTTDQLCSLIEVIARINKMKSFW